MAWNPRLGNHDMFSSIFFLPGQPAPTQVLKLEDARKTMAKYPGLLKLHEYFVVTADSERNLRFALASKSYVSSLIGCHLSKLDSLTSSQPVAIEGSRYVGITVTLTELPVSNANVIIVPGQSAPLPVLTLDQAQQTMEEYRDLSTNKRLRSTAFKRILEVAVSRSDSTNPHSSFDLKFATLSNNQNVYTCIAEDHLSSLRMGDVVCAVNGVMVLDLQTGNPIRSFSDAMSVVRATKEGGALTLKVLSRK